MSELRPVFTDIANAIRTKAGTTEKITPLDMPAAITNLPSGGSEPPAEALVITGDCNYYFKNPLMNWVYGEFGDRMSTKDITRCQSMFKGLEVDYFPHELNLLGNQWQVSFDQAFRDSKLKKPPIVNVLLSEPKYFSIDIPAFYSAEYMEEIPYDFYERIFGAGGFESWTSKIASNGYVSCNQLFYHCSRLKTLPKITMIRGFDDRYSPLQNVILGCLSLKEADLPVPKIEEAKAERTIAAERIAHITFDKNREYYKDEVLDLDFMLTLSGAGSGGGWDDELFPPEKEIKDDATYQQLKNDPLAWASSGKYAFYNHDSAVETINTLPKTSKTCVIKFGGIFGVNTDGGAINTLTEQEIAVAAAKGWTVSLE